MADKTDEILAYVLKDPVKAAKLCPYVNFKPINTTHSYVFGNGCWGVFGDHEAYAARQRLLQTHGVHLVMKVPENRERLILRDRESGDRCFSWLDQ